MSQMLTVPTNFEDISELTLGLAGRVDDGRIILYGPEPVPAGEPVRFSVLLLDQTPALEGTGRAIASIDGGDSRQPEVRFDIVLDRLELAGSAEVVYERILLARQSAVSGEPETGERRVDDVEAEALGAPPSEELALEDSSSYALAPSEEHAVDEPPSRGLGRAEAAPAGGPPPLPTAASAGPYADRSRVAWLARPSRNPSWAPTEVAAPAPRPGSGRFAYRGGLPIPAVPPQPALDPSDRVKPAPRPAAVHAGAALARAASEALVLEDTAALAIAPTHHGFDPDTATVAAGPELGGEETRTEGVPLPADAFATSQDFVDTAEHADPDRRGRD